MTALDEAIAGIDAWIDDEAVHGAAVTVWHRGEIVATHVAGMAAEDRPVDDDTLFALASVSKPVTVAGIMHVLSSNGIDLDTPLSEILPEFSMLDDPFDPDALPQLEAQRDDVTLRHVLSHTSGLPENAGIKRIRMSERPTMDEIVDVMCNLPLQSAPGDEIRYSNAGTALAARAAERIDGRAFHDILQTEILDPAELHDISLKPSESLDARIAHVDDAAGAGSPSESYNSRYWRDTGITWGGYFGTAHDVVRFAAGFLTDQPFPLPDAVKAKMVADQTGGVPGGVHSAGIHWDPGAWGLGWEVKGTKRNHWTGTHTSPATWCHWGQAGTLVWLDPERELGVAMFGNRTVRTAWPLRPPRWAMLSDAIVEATDTQGS